MSIYFLIKVYGKPESVLAGRVASRERIGPKKKWEFQFNMKKHYFSFATWWY
jgi:hypothetical protein